jgi:hypothetical protein
MRQLALSFFLVLNITIGYAQKNIPVGKFNVAVIGDKVGSRDYGTSTEEYYLGYRNDSVFYSEVWIYKGTDLNSPSYTSVDVYACATKSIDKADMGIEQVIGEGYEYFRVSVWTHYKDKKEQLIFTEYKEDAKKVKKTNEVFKTFYANSREPLERLRNTLK